jgi:hypothetical protein
VSHSILLGPTWLICDAYSVVVALTRACTESKKHLANGISYATTKATISLNRTRILTSSWFLRSSTLVSCVQRCQAILVLTLLISFTTQALTLPWTFLVGNFDLISSPLQ